MRPNLYGPTFPDCPKPRRPTSQARPTSKRTLFHVHAAYVAHGLSQVRPRSRPRRDWEGILLLLVSYAFLLVFALEYPLSIPHLPALPQRFYHRASLHLTRSRLPYAYCRIHHNNSDNLYISDTRAAANHLRRRAGLLLASNLICYLTPSFSTRPIQTPTRRILVFIARLSYKIPLAWSCQRQASFSSSLFCVFFLLLPNRFGDEPSLRRCHSPFRFRGSLCLACRFSSLQPSSYALPSPTALRLATASSVLAFASASLAVTFTKPFSFLCEGYIH